jgi:hypothetical protein
MPKTSPAWPSDLSIGRRLAPATAGFAIDADVDFGVGAVFEE